MRERKREAKSDLPSLRAANRSLMADQELLMLVKDHPPHGIHHGPVNLKADRTFPPLRTRWDFSFLRHTFLSQRSKCD